MNSLSSPVVMVVVTSVSEGRRQSQKSGRPVVQPPPG